MDDDIHAKRDEAEWWKKYNDHLRSSEWKELRKNALEKAGNQCEFIVPSPKTIIGHMDFDERCSCTEDLELHHLHYKTFGKEQLNDVIVYCRFHHKIAHVMNKKCIACGEYVIHDYEDAEWLVESCGDLESAMENLSDLCSGCEHFALKDD